MQETKVIHKIINNCGCEDEERYEIRILEGKKLELSCMEQFVKEQKEHFI